MGLVPEEGLGLPPPGLVNRNSVWCGFMGWCTALVGNLINRRPGLVSGVHRQAFGITVGWFIGYHLSRYADYKNAKRDRDMFGYVKLHPEDFKPREKRKMSEVLEPFHPVR